MFARVLAYWVVEVSFSVLAGISMVVGWLGVEDGWSIDLRRGEIVLKEEGESWTMCKYTSKYKV